MVQWMETMVPFKEEIEMSCSEQMISDVDVSVSSANLVPKPDMDGEQRLLELDTCIELGIKIYKEENISFICDMYSTSCDLVPSTKMITYNIIRFKNISKVKVSDRLKLDNESGNVMQVFGSDGVVKIDEVRISELDSDNIIVEGVVYVNVMYISSNDQKPVCVAKQIIPFSHEALASGVSSDSMIFIKPSLEQLTTVMVGNNEIEAKAVVVLDILAMDSLDTEIIEDVREMPFDMEKIKEIPCMVGYMVKSGDTLWKIAKKYYTTVENIKQVNELIGNDIKEGEMLLVVK
jgi:LysM repeat protein